jgi:hypothetical protein
MSSSSHPGSWKLRRPNGRLRQGKWRSDVQTFPAHTAHQFPSPVSFLGENQQLFTCYAKWCVLALLFRALAFRCFVFDLSYPRAPQTEGKGWFFKVGSALRSCPVGSLLASDGARTTRRAYRCFFFRILSFVVPFHPLQFKSTHEHTALRSLDACRQIAAATLPEPGAHRRPWSCRVSLKESKLITGFHFSVLQPLSDGIVSSSDRIRKHWPPAPPFSQRASFPLPLFLSKSACTGQEASMCHRI